MHVAGHSSPTRGLVCYNALLLPVSHEVYIKHAFPHNVSHTHLCIVECLERNTLTKLAAMLVSVSLCFLILHVSHSKQCVINSDRHYRFTVNEFRYVC